MLPFGSTIASVMLLFGSIYKNEYIKRGLKTMKKTKTISLILALVMLTGMLSGCGNSAANDDQSQVAGNNYTNGNETGEDMDDNSANGDKLTETVTLKEYLNGVPRVAFMADVTPDKNSTPSAIYLFENGKVYYVSDRKNQYYGMYGGTNLTYGEISRMTDEELLDFAKTHIVPFWGHAMAVGASSSATVYLYRFATGGKYTLHIYTDSTGNNREYECISLRMHDFSIPASYFDINRVYDNSYEWNISNSILCKFNDITQAVIYDSTFSGLTNGKKTLFFRTGENLTIILDNIGDAGIEID